MYIHFRSSVEFNRYFCISIYIRELHSKWLCCCCCWCCRHRSAATNSLCKNNTERKTAIFVCCYFSSLLEMHNIDFVWNYLNLAIGFHYVYGSFFFSRTETFGITCSKCPTESVVFWSYANITYWLRFLYHCESIWNRQNRQANKQK